jgi:hypothetical protein
MIQYPGVLEAYHNHNAKAASLEQNGFTKKRHSNSIVRSYSETENRSFYWLVLFSTKPCQPSLLIAGKDGAFPCEVPSRCYTLRLTPVSTKEWSTRNSVSKVYSK